MSRIAGSLYRSLLCVLLVLPTAASAEPTGCPLPEPTTAAAGRTAAPNVVLIAVDTLRADHLGVYGYPRDVSPHLDRLAAESLVFERAIAPAPWTTPSFAGLFTGRHPAELGFADEPIRLPTDVPTLGERFADRGYTTVGVVSHLFLGEKFGFHRGFDVWDEAAVGGHDTISSPRVTIRALDCLTELDRAGRPFFLFLHYFDPHYDYLGHPDHPYYEGYDGLIHSGSDNFETLRKLARADKLSRDDLRYLRDLYDSEIAYTDRHVGRVLAALRERDLYDDTIVVFLADHGEMFAERRGRWIGHTRFLYDELVRVPLVIKLPKADGRKGRIRHPVSLVDVGSTLFDRVDGAEKPSPRSLFDTERRPPVFTQTRRWRQLDAVVLDGWKLILDRRSQRAELYDLARDPGERDNRAAAEPARRDSMLAILDAWERYNQSRLAELRGVVVPELTAEEIERLRSLGYIQ